MAGLDMVTRKKSALQHKLNSDNPFIQLISQSLHCLFFLI